MRSYRTSYIITGVPQSEHYRGPKECWKLLFEWFMVGYYRLHGLAWIVIRAYIVILLLWLAISST